MKKLVLSANMAIVGVFLMVGMAFAQTVPGAPATGMSAPASGGSPVTVIAGDSGSADVGGWAPGFVQSLYSNWSKAYGWTPTQPIAIHLYEGGHDFAYGVSALNGSPLTSTELSSLAASGISGITVSTPRGMAIAFNLAASDFGSPIGGAYWMTQAKGALAEQLAMVMLQDTAGTGGSPWLRQGLADYLANTAVPGIQSVFTRSQAYNMAVGQKLAPDVLSINQDWTSLTSGTPTTSITAPTAIELRDAAFWEADQTVGYLVSRVGAPKVVDMLKMASSGQNFETVLQSTTGLTLNALNSAMPTFQGMGMMTTAGAGGM